MQVSDDEAEQIIENAGNAAETSENNFATEVTSGGTVRHGIVFLSVTAQCGLSTCCCDNAS